MKTGEEKYFDVTTWKENKILKEVTNKLSDKGEYTINSKKNSLVSSYIIDNVSAYENQLQGLTPEKQQVFLNNLVKNLTETSENPNKQPLFSISNKIYQSNKHIHINHTVDTATVIDTAFKNAYKTSTGIDLKVEKPRAIPSDNVLQVIYRQQGESTKKGHDITTLYATSKVDERTLNKMKEAFAELGVTLEKQKKKVPLQFKVKISKKVDTEKKGEILKTIQQQQENLLLNGLYHDAELAMANADHLNDLTSYVQTVAKYMAVDAYVKMPEKNPEKAKSIIENLTVKFNGALQEKDLNDLGEIYDNLSKKVDISSSISNYSNIIEEVTSGRPVHVEPKGTHEQKIQENTLVEGSNKTVGESINLPKKDNVLQYIDNNTYDNNTYTWPDTFDDLIIAEPSSEKRIALSQTPSLVSEKIQEEQQESTSTTTDNAPSDLFNDMEIDSYLDQISESDEPADYDKNPEVGLEAGKEENNVKADIPITVTDNNIEVIGNTIMNQVESIVKDRNINGKERVPNGFSKNARELINKKLSVFLRACYIYEENGLYLQKSGKEQLDLASTIADWLVKKNVIELDKQSNEIVVKDTHYLEMFSTDIKNATRSVPDNENKIRMTRITVTTQVTDIVERSIKESGKVFSGNATNIMIEKITDSLIKEGDKFTSVANIVESNKINIQEQLTGMLKTAQADKINKVTDNNGFIKGFKFSLQLTMKKFGNQSLPTPEKPRSQSEPTMSHKNEVKINSYLDVIDKEDNSIEVPVSNDIKKQEINPSSETISTSEEIDDFLESLYNEEKSSPKKEAPLEKGPVLIDELSEIIEENSSEIDNDIVAMKVLLESFSNIASQRKEEAMNNPEKNVKTAVSPSKEKPANNPGEKGNKSADSSSKEPEKGGGLMARFSRSLSRTLSKYLSSKDKLDKKDEPKKPKTFAGKRVKTDILPDDLLEQYQNKKISAEAFGKEVSKKTGDALESKLLIIKEFARLEASPKKVGEFSKAFEKQISESIAQPVNIKSVKFDTATQPVDKPISQPLNIPAKSDVIKVNLKGCTEIMKGISVMKLSTSQPSPDASSSSQESGVTNEILDGLKNVKASNEDVSVPVFNNSNHQKKVEVGK